MRRSVTAAVIAVLAAALPARADVTSFRSSGQCTHLSTGIPVDAAAASELIPDGFVVLEPVPGRAVLAIVIQECETAIDDGPATPDITSVAFIFVDPVRSPAGCETYDLFWTTNVDDDWHRAMQAIGVETALSPDSALRIDALPIGVAGTGVNPYERAPYAYTTVAAADVVTPAGPLVSVHCHAGPRGIVRQTYDHQFRAGGGAVEVTLGSSPLWDRLGATDTTSGSLLARFTWTGVTELVSA